MQDSHPHLRLGRVYDEIDAEAGARLLVDRLWPRGIAKARLALDAWPVGITPSSELRRWLHADPSRWEAFVTRYRAELDAAPDAVETVLDWCRAGPVILLTAARQPEHSHAGVLRDYLVRRCGAGG